MLWLQIILPFLWLAFSSAEFHPCPDGSRRLAILGEDCDFDGDCEGEGVVCREKDTTAGKRQVCDCHPFYSEDPDRRSRCLKRRSDGEECGSHVGLPECRPPMTCVVTRAKSPGKCRCLQTDPTITKDSSGQCVIRNSNRNSKSDNFGDCQSHQDCTIPFSYCQSGKCKCTRGTFKRDNTCYAKRNCPGGKDPSKMQDCVRFTDDQEMAENIIYRPNKKSDNCPSGEFCVTPEGSPLGHCCPHYCPLSTNPVVQYSCSPDAAPNVKCPEQTHFCHRVAGPGYAFAVCCLKPCQGYNSVYFNGECHPPSHVGSKCADDDDCDPTRRFMSCERGKCGCRRGYTPKTGIFTSRDNPGLTCVKQCRDTRLARGSVCHSKVSLGSKCSIQEQCGTGAGCYRGKCTCKCSFVRRGSRCISRKSEETSRGGGSSSRGSGSSRPGVSGGSGGGTATSKPKTLVEILQELFNIGGTNKQRSFLDTIRLGTNSRSGK